GPPRPPPPPRRPPPCRKEVVMVVPTPPRAPGPMRRLLGWLSRLFARPKPVRPQPAPARRRPSFEGLEDRRLFSANVGPVVRLPEPPTPVTLLTRLDPTNLHSIEVSSRDGSIRDNVLLGPNVNGGPAGAFLVTRPPG